MLRNIVLLFTVLLVVCSSAFSTVFNVDNDGAVTVPNSLNWALNKAATTPGPHTINFSIAGDFEVRLLDNVTNDITIDGTTAPGYSCGNPVVGFKCINPFASNIFLNIKGDRNVVRGIAFYAAPGKAFLLDVEGDDNEIYGCSFFMTTDGSTYVPNTNAFGRFEIAGNNNIFGADNDCDRNYMAAAMKSGIWINKGAGNKIIGNYIGTDRTGNSAMGTYQNEGLVIEADGITGSGTVIANNVAVGAKGGFGTGIQIKGCTGKVIVRDNFVGVGKDLSVIGNSFAGIYSRQGANHEIIGNIVGGNGITSGTKSHGIASAGATNILIEGNFLGVTPSGSNIANGQSGVEINGGGPGTIIKGNFIGFNNN